MRPILPAVLLLLVAPATAAADPLATVETPTRPGPSTSFPVVDAHDGRVVWSDYDAAADAWRLMEHSGGAERRVPVPRRSTPFDVDLGPDGRGGTLAVYSRCARSPRRDRPAPDPTSGRDHGCDLYAYSFTTGREREVASANSGGDEAWPAVWGPRIAFVRTYPDRTGRRGRTPYLYWRQLRGGGRSERLRRPSSAIKVRTSTPGGSRTRRVHLPYAISGLDMRSRKVAYAWRRFDDAATSSFVWLATTGGRLRPVADGATTGGGAAVHVRSIGEPALGSRRVHWRFQNEDEPSYFSSFLRRRITAAGRPFGAAGASARSSAVAFGHEPGTAYWIDAGPDDPGFARNRPGGSFALMADDELLYGRVPRSWLPLEPPG